jgi:DNA polymerase III delta prime subunit
MSLAESYDDLGQPRKADQLLSDIFEVSSRLNGEDHVDTLRIIERTLDVHLDREDAPRALQTSELLMRRARNALPNGDLSLAGYLMRTGRALELSDRIGDAIDAYEEAHALYLDFHGEDHMRTQRASDAIARLRG